jgi:hypothetical protein
MKAVVRVQSWRKIWIAAVALTSVAGVACLPRVESTPRLSINAETLDRIDAAMEQLADGRWPSWSMEVSGAQLTFQVEVAEASAADVCSGIGAVVRLAGDEVAWSADLTRDGRPLTSCGNLDLIARDPQALSPNPRS